ncbi:MAG: AraC family transcriptional regulator [Pseudomonadota bacterium]|nr:AraC family transcriptional regulator [Pseudomonadota bacterium]
MTDGSATLRRKLCNAGPPIVRASVLEPLLTLLQERSVDVPALLLRHRIATARLGNPYEPVPLDRWVALLEDVAECTGDRLLGMHVGESFRPEHSGPVGLLFVSAPTLRVALDRFSCSFKVWQSATRIDVVCGTETTSCSYQIEDAAIWPRRQDSELSLAVICGLIRCTCRPGWRPVQVHFEHSAPPGARALVQAFRAPVLFGQGVNRLVIANEDLDRPLERPGAPAAPFLERHVLDLMGESEMPGSFANQLGVLVAQRLGCASIGMQDLATGLGVSVRTLRRRLREEGVSFRDILRAQRQRRAEALMQSGRMPISDIAYSLSYADAAVLSRAFRAWTGSSPRQFVARAREPR